MQIVKQGSRFIARCSYDERAVPKSAGFRWDGINKYWWTDSAAKADTLRDSAAVQALEAANAKAADERAAAVVLTRADDAPDVDVPCPDGLAYLPYQRAGIAFALARTNVLFGDEMGLGKTVQAIGVINSDPTIQRILIFCPASLKVNWRNELNRWLVRAFQIVIAEGSFCPVVFGDILIVNYDVADRHAAALRSVHWDMVIADEAHYMKNPLAKRTVAILGEPARKAKKKTPAKPEVLPIAARRRVFLTGTPIPNRPIEGFPLFHALNPGEFRNLFSYAKRYCAAQENGYGWDMSGSSHLDELQKKLRASIMVRRLKRDVLKELPAKRRSVIEIAANGASDAIEREQEAWARNEGDIERARLAVELAKAGTADEYADAVATLKKAASVAFTEMAQVRRDTAVAKIPYVIEHVTGVLESGCKVIVFAHHHAMIHGLREAFEGAAVIFGEVPVMERQAQVERFQTDAGCRVFIGGIQAAGVGLTLTAASHVVFAELDWVPGNITQCEDRAHRIGQHDMVTVEHLVLEGSIDASMARTLVAKQAILDQALDALPEPQAVVIPTSARDRAATEETTRTQIDREAAKMTPERIAAIHEGLQIIAGCCDGARELDGAGFSRIDSGIGKSLAQQGNLTARQAALGLRLLTKYRRQVPDRIILLAHVAQAGV